MKANQVRLKTTHQYGFRCGEFGTVIGVCMVTPDKFQPRLCYQVLYADGVVDYTAMEGMDYVIEAIE